VPLSQADFGCFRACFCFQSRGADPLRGGGRAPTDPEIKNARPHRSCAYGLAAASPPASPKPNAVGGTQSILFFQGSGGVEFFSLRPLFWRLEVSEQPWERLPRLASLAGHLVRAAARRVGGGCVGPCLDEQRDHPLVAPIGSPVQCRFPRWAGRVELLRRERAEQSRANVCVA